MKVYLAGPMRGLPDFNFPAFRAGARWLRSRGYEVFSPAERDTDIGFRPDGMRGTDAELNQAGFSVREALAVDLTWICTEADAVVLLGGWERSLGAAAEVAAARALRLPVYLITEMMTQAAIAQYDEALTRLAEYDSLDPSMPTFREQHPDFDCGAVAPNRIYPISHGPDCQGHPRSGWEVYSDEWMWTYVRIPAVHFRNDPNTVWAREKYL